MDTQISSYFRLVIGLAFGLILGTAFSCALMRPKLPSEEHVTSPSEGVIPDVKEDENHKAYTNFAKASIYMGHGQYEKAKDTLYFNNYYISY